jgi:hypothetical protein
MTKYDLMKVASGDVRLFPCNESRTAEWIFMKFVMDFGLNPFESNQESYLLPLWQMPNVRHETMTTPLQIILLACVMTP